MTTATPPRERRLFWLACLGFGAIVALAWPDLRDWLLARQQPVSCRAPTADEQLHIVVSPRGQILVADCMYILTRAAGRAAGRAAAAGARK